MGRSSRRQPPVVILLRRRPTTPPAQIKRRPKNELRRALREREKKFREMADLSPLVVYEIDINANLTFFNKQASVIFGFSEHDLMSNFNVLDRVIPEDRVRARENMKKIMNGKSLSNTEYTMIRKDGSTFPALVNSNPVFKDDKPVGLRGIIVDITERKLAEEQLIQERDEARNFLNIVAEIIVALDCEGNVLLVTPGGAVP